MKCVDDTWRSKPRQPIKRTFADDPMMSELHDIREKHYQATRSVPATKRNDRKGNRLVRFLSSYGYQLVPTKRGTRKLVRSLK